MEEYVKNKTQKTGKSNIQIYTEILNDLLSGLNYCYSNKQKQNAINEINHINSILSNLHLNNKKIEVGDVMNYKEDKTELFVNRFIKDNIIECMWMNEDFKLSYVIDDISLFTLVRKADMEKIEKSFK